MAAPNSLRAVAPMARISGASRISLPHSRTLRPERIAGAGRLASRHDAMVAAEQGADYVMFGEPDTSGKCPDFAAVEERIAWWAEVFEIPCVGYSNSLETIPPLVAAGADFIALGSVVWREPDAIAETIREASSHLRLPEPAT